MREGHVDTHPPFDPMLGVLLADRYRIERRIGEGGMGVVYAARHVVLDKVVALKVLLDEYSRRGELVERFLHEAKAAARIRHEHVVDIYDFGQTPSGNVFFAMELLEGRSLADAIDKGEVTWPRIKDIVLQVCSALQAAHDAGVIHRDLKPANIFLVKRLGRSDYVKILDFGIAKLTEIEESRRLTRTGMVFGTPEYMSPEQARGEKADIRVDVYACGCILFEMITGRPPYAGESFMAVLSKHLFDPVPALFAAESCRPGVPRAVENVVFRAMAKNRDERFPSMNELGAALDAVDEVSGVSYRPPSPRVGEEGHLARDTEGRPRTPAPETRSPVEEIAPRSLPANSRLSRRVLLGLGLPAVLAATAWAWIALRGPGTEARSPTSPAETTGIAAHAGAATRADAEPEHESRAPTFDPAAKATPTVPTVGPASAPLEEQVPSIPPAPAGKPSARRENPSASPPRRSLHDKPASDKTAGPAPDNEPRKPKSDLKNPFE
ncbi:MAG: protein kinase [Deltaproteobacteria bacterium]|nr:protein kinase [Deltaproteobacteria bacterium]